jgi:hypothetical protein
MALSEANMKHFVAIACTALLAACVATPNHSRAVVPDASASTGLPQDSRGFSIVETEHATVLAEPGVGYNSEREVGQLFELGYQIVSEDLGTAVKRPSLYVYVSEQLMYQDLIKRWGYPEWVRTVHTIPRMHRDYIEWIPPLQRRDVAFITHEYSHRIIEQIAGLNS